MKSTKRNLWEMRARAEAAQAASLCDTLDECVRYFTNSLTRYKRDSTGHISDAYKAEKAGDGLSVNIFHTPAQTAPRLIAIIQ